SSRRRIVRRNGQGTNLREAQRRCLLRSDLSESDSTDLLRTQGRPTAADRNVAVRPAWRTAVPGDAAKRDAAAERASGGPERLDRSRRFLIPASAREIVK